MKVWVAICAEEEPYFGGCSAVAKAYAYASKEILEANCSATYKFELDHKEAFRMFPGILTADIHKNKEQKALQQEWDKVVHYYFTRQSILNQRDYCATLNKEKNGVLRERNLAVAEKRLKNEEAYFETQLRKEHLEELGLDE
jgi:general stress protein 26